MFSWDPVALPQAAHYLQTDSIRSLILKTLGDFELRRTTVTSLQAEDKDSRLKQLWLLWQRQGCHFPTDSPSTAPPSAKPITPSFYMTTRNNRLCAIIEGLSEKGGMRKDGQMDGWKERQMQWPHLSLMFNFTQFQLYAIMMLSFPLGNFTCRKWRISSYRRAWRSWCLLSF